MSIGDVDYDPFGREMRRDPYPIYRWLREHAPIYHSRSRELWAVSRHEDLIALTSDWATFSNARGADTDNFGAYLTAPGNFFDSDPPLHDVLRAVVHRSFTPNALRQRLESIVRENLERLLRELADCDEADFAQGLAWPLPVRVMGAFLGLPEQDLPRLRRLGEDVARRTAGIREPPAVAVGALGEIAEYMEETLEARRRQPGDDLLSVIATATLEGDPIGPEAAGIATVLAIAGVETTASLIGNSLLLLAKHPDQRVWLGHHPEAIPDAVEEVLRFESPVQHTRRVTSRGVELHGVSIPAGAPVALLYGSANRDERRYQDAERFDISRERKRNLAFGNGIHHCIGAPLARMQAVIVLESILQEMPDYELAGPIERFQSHMGRSLQTLPLRQNRR